MQDQSNNSTVSQGGQDVIPIGIQEAHKEKRCLEQIQTWINQYLIRHRYEVMANKLLKVGTIIQKPSDVLQKAQLDYYDQCRFINLTLDPLDRIDKAKPKELEAAFAQFVRTEWHKHLHEKNVQMRFDATLDHSELHRFVEACTGQKRDVDIFVVAHWIWQIKRKMLGLSVCDHIMPIFVGRQGSGKSTAVQRLALPIQDYKIDMQITALADDRNFHALEETFVIVCDEMQGHGRADLDVLKGTITAPYRSARRLYTHMIDRIPQNASLVGTSNKMLGDLIKDETGLRRFHAFNCKDTMDWDAINSIDYLKIWQSIDEREESGYLRRVIAALQVEQESHRFKNSVESYLEETGALSEGDRHEISVADIFADYVEWCQSCQFRPFDKNAFSKSARSLGIEGGRTSKCRTLKVSKSFRGHKRLTRDQLLDTAETFAEPQEDSKTN